MSGLSKQVPGCVGKHVPVSGERQTVSACLYGVCMRQRGVHAGSRTVMRRLTPRRYGRAR